MYYFGSGPATIPKEVLKEASENILRQKGGRLSILEIPHRGCLFKEIVEESETIVLSLLQLNPDEYEVCWMHGGGRTLFSLIPMNFLNKENKAGYIDSGHWAREAQNFANFYGQTETIASSQKDNYHSIPDWGKIPSDLAYLHITSNNTLYGTQYHHLPETDVPIIADMTSELFSRKIDYSRFSIIYAAAQKNVGPAGVTLCIIRKDFLSQQRNSLPGIFSFKDLFAAHSAYNTPPVFAIYCSLLYLRWTAKMGMDLIASRNKQKADALYKAIDDSKLFYCPVKQNSRSQMNACFFGHTHETEEALIDFVKSKFIMGIEGHRSVGGLRVGLYNAINPEDVEYLINAMKEFESVFSATVIIHDS